METKPIHLLAPILLCAFMSAVTFGFLLGMNGDVLAAKFAAQEAATACKKAVADDR